MLGPRIFSKINKTFSPNINFMVSQKNPSYGKICFLAVRSTSNIFWHLLHNSRESKTIYSSFQPYFESMVQASIGTNIEVHFNFTTMAITPQNPQITNPLWKDLNLVVCNLSEHVCRIGVYQNRLNNTSSIRGHHLHELDTAQHLRNGNIFVLKNKVIPLNHL